MPWLATSSCLYAWARCSKELPAARAIRSAAVVTELNPEGLRPSIETTLHALLPHQVGSIPIPCARSPWLSAPTPRRSLPDVSTASTGLAVPYKKPGLPLTQLIAKRLHEQPAGIIVLGNHGLVVGAETVGAADRLLREVEDGSTHRCARRRRAIALALAQAAAELGLRVVMHECTRWHRPAADARATAGSLYPDHVIFLGPAAPPSPATLRAPASFSSSPAPGRCFARHHAQRRRARLVPGPRPGARARGCRAALSRRCGRGRSPRLGRGEIPPEPGQGSALNQAAARLGLGSSWASNASRKRRRQATMS